ncbi:MAG: hypothetical protein AB7D29_09940 [Campylobacterales bacterium]
MRSSLFAIIAAIFLLAGCFDKEVFSKVEDASIVDKAPEAVKITGDEHGIVKLKSDTSSNIEVRIQKVKASCSTERSRSLGSDFDGYILIEVYKDGKFAAKAQMDFKTEPSKKDYEKVWRGLMAELKWN